jgi:two-component system response regulator VicR
MNINGANINSTNIENVKVSNTDINRLKTDNLNINNSKINNLNINNSKINNLNIENAKMNNQDISNIPKKILVVDDEPDNLELVKFVLEGAGFEAIVVNNGLDALAKINTVEFDLVLLDIMLPDIAGWNVLKKIKERNTNLPVIILTAKARNIDKLLGMKVLKADGYITKPFLKKELIDKVKRLTKS